MVRIFFIFTFGTLLIPGDARGQAAYNDQPLEYWINTLRGDEDEKRRTAAYAIGQIGPTAKQAVPDLVKVLEDENLELSYYAVDALGRIGPDAREAVDDILGSLELRVDDKNIFYRNAVTALGRIGPDASAAIPILKNTLTNEDHSYRVDAALAWWKIEPNADAAQALVSILLESSGEAPFQAGLALLELGDDVHFAAPRLVGGLGHADPDVRRVVAKILGGLGLSAVPLITKSLETPNKAGTEPAIAALAYIIDQNRGDVLYNSSVDSKAFMAVARPLMNFAVPALSEQLADSRESVRLAAANTLAKLGPLGVLSLLKSAQSKNKLARESAAKALSRMERYLPRDGETTPSIELVKQKLVDPLIAAINSDDRGVRRIAVRAFAALRIGPSGSRAAPILRDALRDEDVAVRRYAAQALERLP